MSCILCRLEKNIHLWFYSIYPSLIKTRKLTMFQNWKTYRHKKKAIGLQNISFMQYFFLSPPIPKRKWSVQRIHLSHFLRRHMVYLFRFNLLQITPQIEQSGNWRLFLFHNNIFGLRWCFAAAGNFRSWMRKRKMVYYFSRENIKWFHVERKKTSKEARFVNVITPNCEGIFPRE